MEQQTPEKFAFGCNETHNCTCPALAAGLNPEGVGDEHVPGVLEAAEQYDSKAQMLKSGYQGTLPEPKTKEAWLAAIDDMEPGSEEHKQAVKVANTLEWM